MVNNKEEVIKCKCSNNYSWVFWMIFLIMVGYLVYYVVSTIEELKANPEDFFEGGNIIMGVMAWL